MCTFCTRRQVLRVAAAAPVALACGLGAGGASAQARLPVGVKQGCSYDGSTMIDDVYGFEASPEAIGVVESICGKVGLPPNFVTLAANVPNAAAVIDGDKRYILYSEIFMADILKATGNRWSSLSVLAHEIGHHLSGHTLSAAGSRPATELEADKFSGFIISRLGGNLDDATSVIRRFGGEGSETHPPRSARLEAIAVGWRSGRQQGAPSQHVPAENAAPAGGATINDFR